MDVVVKDFYVELRVNNKGIEFEVRDNDGNFRGDCILTKTGIIWCEGKTKRKNGVDVSWEDFIQWMNS